MVRIGDIVKVPAKICGLQEDTFAEVVGVYRNFFNVRYDLGWEQSFRYDDLNKLITF